MRMKLTTAIQGTLLSIPMLVIGCGGGDGSKEDIIPLNSDTPHAYLLTGKVLPLGQKTTIDMTSIYSGGARLDLKTRFALNSNSSVLCDPDPLFEATDSSARLTVDPDVSNDDLLHLCAYEFEFNNLGSQSQSVLAFGVRGEGAAMPSLPRLEVVGQVGSELGISIPSNGSLNPNIIAIGAAETQFTVDTKTKHITYLADAPGVVRVMYSVSVDEIDYLGEIDFTVSRVSDSAPVALHSEVVLLPNEEVTIDLTQFLAADSNGVESLIFDRDHNGEAIGYEHLSLEKVTSSLGLLAKKESEHPTKFLLATSYPGKFQVHYQIIDGNGGYASNTIDVTVKGESGLLVEDAIFSLVPSQDPRSFEFDVRDFVQTSTGLSQVSIVSNSLQVEHSSQDEKQPFTMDVRQDDTRLVLDYPGGMVQGLTQLKFKVTDALSGLVTPAQAHIDVGRNLPKFMRLNVSGISSGTSPTTGDVLHIQPWCQSGIPCDENLTQWAWYQSGDQVAGGIGPEFSRYQVQEFSCDDTLEVRVTPVAIVDGQELKGIASRTTWSPSTAPELKLSTHKEKENTEVTLNVRVCPNAEAKIAITKGFDRQNRPDVGTGLLVKVSNGGELHQMFPIQTDANGEATLQLIAPKGGVKSVVEVTSRGAKSQEEIIISTITSPDHEKANLWGHMPNILVVTDPVSGDELVMHRPFLDVELAGLLDSSMSTTAEVVEGEIYAKFNWWDANVFCESTVAPLFTRQGLGTSRLPSVNEVQMFYPLVPKPGIGGLMQKFGWPDLLGSWTNEVRFEWNDEYYLWHSSARQEPDLPEDWYWIGYNKSSEFHGASCVANFE